MTTPYVWQTSAALAAMLGVLLPVIIGIDYIKHGRIVSESDYWKNWFGIQLLLLIMICSDLILTRTAWQAIAMHIGGVGFGLLGSFWVAWIAEWKLRSVGGLK